MKEDLGTFRVSYSHMCVLRFCHLRSSISSILARVMDGWLVVCSESDFKLGGRIMTAPREQDVGITLGPF